MLDLSYGCKDDIEILTICFVLRRVFRDSMFWMTSTNRFVFANRFWTGVGLLSMKPVLLLRFITL